MKFKFRYLPWIIAAFSYLPIAFSDNTPGCIFELDPISNTNLKVRANQSKQVTYKATNHFDTQAFEGNPGIKFEQQIFVSGLPQGVKIDFKEGNCHQASGPFAATSFFLEPHASCILSFTVVGNELPDNVTQNDGPILCVDGIQSHCCGILNRDHRFKITKIGR